MKRHRKLKNNLEHEFFAQFEGVVFGVLKRLNISPWHPDYDDYAQIGRMKLVAAYEEFPQNPWHQDHRNKFVGYAFTKIRWAIIDALRKQATHRENEQEWNELFDTTLACTQPQIADNLLEQEWLTAILQLLTPEEKRLIIDLCIYHLTITTIASKEGVSRKTIYQRRNRIKNKLQHTLYKNYKPKE